MSETKKAKKEIVVSQEKEVSQFIQQAIENKLPVETMEKLFSLREKVKAEKAREAFVEAMASFQDEIPVIQKTKKVLNKDGRTIRYQYAPIESIVDQIKSALVKNNLSYSWDVENKEGFIKAIAKVTHILGHSETSSFEVPVDKEGFMTAPQKYASALTFAKRYSLCNALGISTADEDTDAVDVNNEPNVKSLKARIIFLLRSLEREATTKDQIEEAVKEITKLSLSEKNYSEIVARLEVSLKEKQEYENSNI